MRAAGLHTHLFDHMLASRSEFESHVECVRPSPYLDVTGSLEAYKSRLSDTGKKTLSDTLRFGRKAAREIGGLRFEFRSQDAALLETLFAWKSRQYIELGAGDFFADWQPRRYLLNLLRRSQDPGFCGALSALWAGDKLLALHMGMLARGVLHWWFPVYHPQYSAYSPGRIMLAKLAEEAPALGLTKIDLGKGEEAYKLRCMTGATQLAEGCIETRALHRWWRRQHLRWTAALRNSPPYELARKWKRKLSGGSRCGG